MSSKWNCFEALILFYSQMGHRSHHLLRRIRYCASSPLTFAGRLVPS